MSAAADTLTPMLATLSARRDFDEGWIFERKLDGVRVLATRRQDDDLRLDGGSTIELPLRTRKTLPRTAFGFRPPLRFTPHRNRNGDDLLEQACGRGWEGLIAKRADAPYVHHRSTDWLKLKCSGAQE